MTTLNYSFTPIRLINPKTRLLSMAKLKFEFERKKKVKLKKKEKDFVEPTEIIRRNFKIK